MSGTAPDAEVSVRIDGQTYGGKSALAVIAHPYYRQSVVLALSYVIRGVQFGFAGWFVCLILFRQALKRRRERALQDRVIAGTLVTTEKKLAALTGSATDLRSLAIGKDIGRAAGRGRVCQYV